MKPLMLAGSILSALGIIALVVGNFINVSTNEKYPHNGKVQLTAKHDKVISIPPVLGGLALAGGIALMVVAARR
jgi:hypothetical protein